MLRSQYKLLTEEEISNLDKSATKRYVNLLTRLLNELKVQIDVYEDVIKRIENRASYLILFTFIFSLFALIQDKVSNNLNFYFIGIFPSLIVAVFFNILVFIKSPSGVLKNIIIEEEDDLKFKLAKTQSLIKLLDPYWKILDTLRKRKIQFLRWSSSFMFSHFIFSILGVYFYLFELEFINCFQNQLLILIISVILAIIFRYTLYESKTLTVSVSKNI